MPTVAGDGACCYSGDGPAVGSEIGNGYVTADPNGNLFLSDTNNELLRWVTPTGEMITFAGTLEAPGFSGDGGAALKAQFYLPAQIARDSTGNTSSLRMSITCAYVRSLPLPATAYPQRTSISKPKPRERSATSSLSR